MEKGRVLRQFRSSPLSVIIMRNETHSFVASWWDLLVTQRRNLRDAPSNVCRKESKHLWWLTYPCENKQTHTSSVTLIACGDRSISVRQEEFFELFLAHKYPRLQMFPFSITKHHQFYEQFMKTVFLIRWPVKNSSRVFSLKATWGDNERLARFVNSYN